MIRWAAGSYLSKFTPPTTVTASSGIMVPLFFILKGAVSTTFFALLRWPRSALSSFFVGVRHCAGGVEHQLRAVPGPGDVAGHPAVLVAQPYQLLAVQVKRVVLYLDGLLPPEPGDEPGIGTVGRIVAEVGCQVIKALARLPARGYDDFLQVLFRRHEPCQELADPPDAVDADRWILMKWCSWCVLLVPVTLPPP